MAAHFQKFQPEALRFLRDLRRNNDRDWFNEHKEVYETQVKEPLKALVLDLNEELERFAPEYQTDPKKAIYRIYRDIRFSPNKDPYKTHAAASFHHRGLGKHSSACYYFHFSPDEMIIGGGLYAPGSKELLAIRRRINREPETLRGILQAKSFKKYFELEGEQLKRPPKGFSADDPGGDLLLYKQFLAGGDANPALATSPKLKKEIVARFEACTPLLTFLNEAIVEG